MGDVLHELLRRVVEADARAGVGQAERIERLDDVEWRGYPNRGSLRRDSRRCHSDSAAASRSCR